jgi:RimJ/RimL family protein N-acetyltransferase
LDERAGADPRNWLGFVDLSIAGPGKGCRENDVEIGYFLVRSAWGKGIATEAAAAVRDAAFSRHGLAELIGRHRVENTASAQVLAKTGFSFVREHVFPDGVVVHVYRLRKAEWQRLPRNGTNQDAKQHWPSAPTTASGFLTEKPAA